MKFTELKTIMMVTTISVVVLIGVGIGIGIFFLWYKWRYTG
jgi:hypothetical protein